MGCRGVQNSLWKGSGGAGFLTSGAGLGWTQDPETEPTHSGESSSSLQLPEEVEITLLSLKALGEKRAVVRSRGRRGLTLFRLPVSVPGWKFQAPSAPQRPARWPLKAQSPSSGGARLGATEPECWISGGGWPVARGLPCVIRWLATEGLDCPELRLWWLAAVVAASAAGPVCPASRWIAAASSSPA